MSKEMDFFIFLLEQYAENKKTTADKVLKKWDSLEITQLIFNMYERYHCEGLENAFNDIDALSERQTDGSAEI
ncbi:MAG: DUF3791 domain-containing protein [Oscillospiraceae bacterium]|nr:DUF3791 domain-containing protein [Oscillospiraceae bacterium]